MIAETGGKQPVIWVVNWRVVLHYRSVWTVGPNLDILRGGSSRVSNLDTIWVDSDRGVRLGHLTGRFDRGVQLGHPMGWFDWGVQVGHPIVRSYRGAGHI